jgi:hypothetical protein
MDMGRDAAWYTSGSWKPRYVSGIELILCTRTWLEWKVRGRVATLPQVQLRQRCSVEGLLTDATRAQVVGVRVKTPEGEETLSADLVVDAAGRGSRAPAWLETLGYGRPQEEEVGLQLAYTSRFFEPPVNYREDWKMMGVFPRSPQHWRGGFIACVEGGGSSRSTGTSGTTPPRMSRASWSLRAHCPSPTSMRPSGTPGRSPRASCTRSPRAGCCTTSE